MRPSKNGKCRVVLRTTDGATKIEWREWEPPHTLEVPLEGGKSRLYRRCGARSGKDGIWVVYYQEFVRDPLSRAMMDALYGVSVPSNLGVRI